MHEQLHVGDMPQEHLWNEIKNIQFIKPRGGLWTSTFLPDGTSDWIRWCINNEFGNVENKNKWRLTPSKDARVFTVNDPNDIRQLCNGQASGCFAIPDFEKIMDQYDAIRLTKEGERQTRFSMPFSFYGWDCESTLWLRWKFDDVRPLEKVA